MEDYTQAETEPIHARSRAIKRSLANLRQIDEVEKERAPMRANWKKTVVEKTYLIARMMFRACLIKSSESRGSQHVSKIANEFFRRGVS